MITSMTGFGTAEGTIGTQRLTVEVRTVNHRFFTPAIKLPSALSRFEGEIRDALRKRIARGHVTLSAWLERDVQNDVAIDEARVEAYVAQLRQLADRFQLEGGVDLATVMRMPDVLGSGRRDEEIASSDELLGIVERAVEALIAMRQAEGARIAAYLEERLQVVEGALTRIEARGPERLIEQRDRMHAALAELLNGSAPIDPQRMIQEVAILAERLDVGEETSRFRAHIAAFRDAMATSGADAVGKRLGFLLQEMLREANTTGSKANDAPMLSDVVLVKEELERLREQVENVE